MRSAHTSALALSSLALALSAAACDTQEPREPYQPMTITTTPPESFTSCAPGAKRHCGPSTCGGIVTCGEDGLWPTEAEACQYPAETCDGSDNDCDGAVDESFTDLGDACDYSSDSCAGPGVKSCSLDGSATECRPASALRNTPETCNGSDEDCDGFIDEDFNVGASCSAGVGACNEAGAYVCNDSGNGTVCDAVPSEPRDETCNYADDDCDGTNDEGFLVGEVCSDGEGECRAEAIYECSGSGRGVTCSARATAPSAELCDGLDNDCDGSADESFEAGEPTLHTMSRFGFTRSSASTYAYDAEGRVAAVERAFASEPGRFQTQSYTYDAEGNVTSVSVTDNGASAELASFELTYTYDAEGMLEQVALEGDAAGRVSRYSYNAEGQLEQVTYLETTPAEVELGFALYSYDAEGQLTEVLTSGPTSPMSDAEAEEELCMVYSYGELGVSAVSYDEGCDESVESVEVYMYDDAGTLTMTTRAGGAEGQLLMSTREQLSAEGELLYEALDEDGDGVVDMTYTYMYSEEGALTLVMYDIDADGEADFDLHINYNEEGQHVSTESTPVGLTEPVIDRWSYSYDEEGRVSSEAYDMNADDEIDSLTTYTYDADGRLEVLRVEAGETWYEERYSYEAESTQPSSAVIEGDREETSASFVYEADQLMSAEYTQGELLISRELHALGCWVEQP